MNPALRGFSHNAVNLDDANFYTTPNMEIHMEPSDAQPRRLTIDDPLSDEALASFRKIREAEVGIAVENLRLDAQKVQLLAASKRLQKASETLFEKVLVERGLPPTAAVEFDSETGLLRLMNDGEPQGEPERG